MKRTKAVRRRPADTTTVDLMRSGIRLRAQTFIDRRKHGSKNFCRSGDRNRDRSCTVWE